VLYQKNADARVPVASTQKLLTALVVLDSGDLSDPVRIAREDTRVEPMKLGLRAGEIYSRSDLMAALIIKSENDAAAALARDVAGGEAPFAEKMNAMAWDLGARSSHFVNPHGLPAPQYSTARDMARISWKAYGEPEIRRLSAKKYHAFVFNNGRTKMLENTNKLLGEFYAVNGMKTGFTNAAGRCLIASASANGREAIFVQLGSRTSHIFDDAERMLRWVLAAY
jgi:D-alanyl-D-alanine carboxypeptidase (penicillin-binding protein 5/6)